MSVIACALLGRASEVEPWAAAAALTLGRSAGVGVVLWWAGADDVHDPPVSVPSPARRAAATTALRLGGLGVEASARGRLVRALLPEAEAAAVAAAERVAVALSAPCVLAMCGVRGEELDGLLDAIPRVAVVSDPGGPLAALVADGLADSGFSPRCLPRAPGGPALLARAGLLAPPPLRRALAPLLEDVR